MQGEWKLVALPTKVICIIPRESRQHPYTEIGFFPLAKDRTLRCRKGRAAGRTLMSTAARAQGILLQKGCACVFALSPPFGVLPLLHGSGASVSIPGFRVLRSYRVTLVGSQVPGFAFPFRDGFRMDERLG